MDSHYTKACKNEGFEFFIDKFMYLAHTTFHVEHPPIIHLECKMLLHLSLNIKVGDWYMYQNYTILKIYRLEVEPYLLLVYLTPQIFSLEYIKQKINSIHLYFSSKHQKTFFTLTTSLLFYDKNKSVLTNVGKILSSYKVDVGKMLHYDPHHVISKLMSANKYAPYMNHDNLELERLANKEHCAEVQGIIEGNKLLL
jgi:hypothetical protein